MKEINEDELQFVVHHYEEGALDTDRALQRLRQHAPVSAGESGGEAPHSTGTRRLSMPIRRIAASVSIAFIVGASVACGFWYARQQTISSPQSPDYSLLPSPSSLKKPYRYLQPKAESIVLKYDNAPIDDVLSELSSYYGRTLVLQSPSASHHSISGEIEATSLEEVVEILEATLDIDIEIQNKN